HSFWQTRFGGDPDVLGRSVVMDGETYTVVGVLPERFEFLDAQVELWRPLAIDRAEASRDRRNLLVVARLAPGVTTDEADAAMATMGERLAGEYPEANRGYTVQVLNLRENMPSSQDRQLLAMIQGALVFVLLIACANVANLLLARTQGRITELAVRSSLGAGRWRIARQLGVEALVASVVGGVLGLGGGALVTHAIADVMAARIPRFWLPTIDGRVLLFTAGVTVFAGLLVGFLPALQTVRLNVQDALKEGGRSASLGGRRRLMTKALVVAEIALALVLLGGGSVLIQTFLDIQKRDPGFETAGLTTLRVTLPDDRYDSPAARATVFADLVERLDALPGVKNAAAASIRPRTPVLPSEPFTVEGAPPPDGQAAPSAGVVAAGPELFETLGIDLLEGRRFLGTDGPDAARVALVNRSFAERYFPDDEPVGRRIVVRNEPRRVVGVVRDVIHGVFFEREQQPAIYLPLAQESPPGAAITLRTEVDSAALANPVREALSAYDPGLVVTQVQSLDEFTQQFFVGMQMITAILGGFGTLALLLAALGTYGVLAYSVAQRTHEIGVRIALGARGAEVRRMVTRQGLLLAVLGIGLGVPGVILVTRAIGATMANMAEVEPLTVLAVALALTVVTLFASWMPARRAAAVDPLVALRGD
ncbi:MAG: ADOP family duplicated permease, partial [Acidobacteriota bacterium]